MLSKSDVQIIENLLDRKLDEKLDQKLKPVHSKLNKLNDKIDLVARVLDRDYVHLRKRVDRVEDHLSLPPFPSDL